MKGLRDKLGLAFGVAAAAIAVWLIVSVLQWNSATRSYESQFIASPESVELTSESRGRLFLENDSYYWIGYAREMVGAGQWRIRHTHLDNPPDGRPVHWSQSVSWLLVLSGFVRHTITGEAMHASIEGAAVWIGPLLHLALIVGTGYLLLRRMGLIPALIWMINLLTLPAVQWSFHPMRPDHHGLHLGFLLSSLLCLILGGLGWIRSSPEIPTAPRLFSPLQLPDKRHARRLFMMSGVLGGLGIWTGATVQLLGVGLFAVGAILLTFLQPPHPTNGVDEVETCDPSLWRWWATAGAATSIICYLIEYAPSFPGMRLEVNHPLYALSWLCAGELIFRVSAAQRPARAGSRLGRALFFAGAVLLPALLLFGPSEWHTLRDPFMRRIHLFIDEFRPYFAVHRTARTLAVLMNFGLLPLFVALVPFLSGRSAMRMTRHERSAVWMAFFGAFAYAALTVWQARWANFFSAFGLLLAVVVLAALWRIQNTQHSATPWLRVLVTAMFLQSACFLGAQLRDIHFRDISEERIGELIAPILQRQFAERMGALNTHGDFRIMGGPHMAARLHYYGRLPNVSSYYWENVEGLRAAATFFAAENDEDAWRVARRHGITHVVLPPSPDFVRMFYYIENGSFSEAGSRNSLAGRMLAQPDALPKWMHRDLRMERALQPGYLFAGEPLFGTLLVFTVDQDDSSQIP